MAALYLTLSLPEDSSTVDELVISPRPFFTTSLRYMLKCPHRGVYQVGVDTLWVSDVFGLFTLRRVINDRSIVLTVQPVSYTHLDVYKRHDIRLVWVNVWCDCMSGASVRPVPPRGWHGCTLSLIHI